MGKPGLNLVCIEDNFSNMRNAYEQGDYAQVGFVMGYTGAEISELLGVAYGASKIARFAYAKGSLQTARMYDSLSREAFELTYNIEKKYKDGFLNSFRRNQALSKTNSLTFGAPPGSAPSGGNLTGSLRGIENQASRSGGGQNL